jgi:hypothetical protein
MNAVHLQITYLGLIRRYMNCAEESLHLDPPVTVRGVLDCLVQRHGEHLRDIFYDTQGWLDPRILFLIDGERPESHRGLDTELTGEEEIQILMGLPLRGG